MLSAHAQTHSAGCIMEKLGKPPMRRSENGNAQLMCNDRGLDTDRVFFFNFGICVMVGMTLYEWESQVTHPGSAS